MVSFYLERNKLVESSLWWYHCCGSHWVLIVSRSVTRWWVAPRGEQLCFQQTAWSLCYKSYFPRNLRCFIKTFIVTQIITDLLNNWVFFTVTPFVTWGVWMSWLTMGNTREPQVSNRPMTMLKLFSPSWHERSTLKVRELLQFQRCLAVKQHMGKKNERIWAGTMLRSPWQSF